MSSKGSSALSTKRAAAAAAAAAVKSNSLSALDDKKKIEKDDESASSDDETVTPVVDSYPSSGLLSLSQGATIAADAHAAAVAAVSASESGMLDDHTAKRHKSKWSRDVSRLVGQHIPFQQFAPYNESGNTRNLLRGYCKMCTRKVTICCKKCHVYLCIEVFAGDDGQETKSCWEVFHTEGDPDVFMNKTASNKRAEKVHRQQLAAQHAQTRRGDETGDDEETDNNKQAMDEEEEHNRQHDAAVVEVRDTDAKDEAEAVTFSWESKDKKKRMRDK